MARRSRSAWAALAPLLAASCAQEAPAAEARAIDLAGRLRSSVVTAGAVDVGSPRGAALLELGWHRGEGDARSGWRAWAKGREARVWLPVDGRPGGTLWVRAAPPAFLEDQTLTVLLDGESLGTRELAPGMQWLGFPVRAAQLETDGEEIFRRRVVLRAAKAGSQIEHGAGSDRRSMSFVCDWVLLAPDGVQPAGRVAELRAREGQRAAEGGLRLLPGDRARVVVPGDTALDVDLVHEGGPLRVEVSEAGGGRSLRRETAGGPGARTTALDLVGLAEGEIELELAVRSDAAPVHVRRAELRALARQWNLVLIVVDTLRADALSDEEDAYDTPALDALARESIVFPHAFAHAPMTLPAHTALFSSRLPHASGVVNNWQDVSRDLPLLSEWLARFGYRTRAVLSLGTLWNEDRGTTVDRGFDLYDTGVDDMAKAPFTEERLRRAVDGLDTARPFFLFAHFSDPHEPYNTREGVEKRARLRWNGEEVAAVTTSDMTVWKGDVVLRPGRNELQVDSSHDFFVKHLYCRAGDERLPWTFEEGALREEGDRLRAVVEHDGDAEGRAHLNLWIHDAPDDAERRRRYREEVAFVDRSIAAFLDRLRERDLLETSLVVFTSDHGEALGERGSWGHVETLKDEMIHVPLVVRTPAGHPDAGALRSRADTLVRHVDLAPTILDLLTLPPMPGQSGVSLLEDAERVVISETHRPEAARDKYCLRDHRYKMIYVAPDEARGLPESFEMYDLERDPGELVDVFGTARGERPDWEGSLRDLAALYAQGRGRVEIDDDQLERLEALGYMQHGG